jgi:hypothetical protein
MKDREDGQRRVNASQSKFIEETWPMSQTQPNTHLFQLGQDNITIDELLVLETRLEIAAEIRIDASKNMCETDDKNQTKT